MKIVSFSLMSAALIVIGLAKSSVVENCTEPLRTVLAGIASLVTDATPIGTMIESLRLESMSSSISIVEVSSLIVTSDGLSTLSCSEV